MNVALKGAIASALRANRGQDNDYFVGQVGLRESELDVTPASFLRRYRIYQVFVRRTRKPFVFHVGYASGELGFVLTGRPEAFVQMVATEGVALSSPEAACAYGATYLSVTGSSDELFYLVASVDDVRFRRTLDEEEQAAKAAFPAKFGGVIGPASAQKTPGGFLVLAYAVRQQALERHELLVRLDGRVEAGYTVVEADLPLIYGG